MRFCQKHGVILGMALFVLAAAWLFVQPDPKLKNHLDLSVVPMQDSRWVGHEVGVDGIQIDEELAPQAFLLRNYQEDLDPPVNLCLVYNYARRSRSFHDPWICYPAQGYTLTDLGHRIIHIGRHTVNAAVVEATKDGVSYLVLYWYMSGDKALKGHAPRSGLISTIIKSRLTRSIGVSTMVRVSAPIGDSVDTTFAQLRSFLDVFYPRILDVKADIAQAPMPAQELWSRDAVGKLALVLCLVLPATLAVGSLYLSGRDAA